MARDDSVETLDMWRDKARLGQQRIDQRYTDKQRAMGRKSRKFWLTDDEREHVVSFIEQMRQAQDAASG